MNPFLTFDIPASASPDLATVEARFNELAAKHHPDQGGNKADFEELNQAYQILSSPAKCLKAYLAVAGIPHDPRGTVGNELMDLFMEVASLVQSSEAFIRKKHAAQSALAKALLEPESMATQTKISSLIQSIESAESTQLEQLSSATQDAQLSQIARNLAFLEKWRAQLQQLYGSLF
ncbi:DnaJ domain-containing protein [Rubritalea marina]|uniref:DnaJ domain-containing protein n=1 Tax=Rubritalea marina TaxID=361055 RepID=UPI0003661C6A|nr:DnaJ domain-containing protein [Rubritalea marina]